MRESCVIFGLLLALCIPMACSDKSTEPTSAVKPVDTLAVQDISYVDRVRYDLGRLPLRRAASDTLPEPDKYDFVAPGDSITRLIVFQDDNAAEPIDSLLRIRAECFIDPDDTLSDDPLQIYRTTGYFEVVGPEYYYFDPVRYNVWFNHHYVGKDYIIAVYMEVLRRRGDSVYVDTVGCISDSSVCLKLIKPRQYLDVNHHVWEYVWRNIYQVANVNWIFGKLDIEIFRGSPISYNQIDPNDSFYTAEGAKYIQILGLDKGDNLSHGLPDGMVDRYAFVDQSSGRLTFPDRHPFDSDSSFYVDEDGHPVYLDDSVPEIYLDLNRQNLPAASKYYLGVFYEEP